VIKDNHSIECQDDTKSIANQAGVEIGSAKILEAKVFSSSVSEFQNGFINVIFQTKSDENTWNHNITKSQHREVRLVNKEVYGEDKLNGSINWFSDCQHDISSVHPEDVIEEETPKQDESNLEVGQDQTFYSSNAKGNTKQVIQEPVLGHKVSDGWNYSNNSRDDISLGELNVEALFDEDKVQIKLLINNILLLDGWEELFEVMAQELYQTQKSKESEICWQNSIEEIFIKELVNNIQSKQDSRSVDWEHVGIFYGHLLHLILLFFVCVLLNDYSSITSNINAGNTVEEKLERDGDGDDKR